MVKTRLLKLMGKDSFTVLQEIIWQWIGLLAQLVLVGCIAISISDAFYGNTNAGRIVRYILIALLSIGARLIFIKLQYDAKENASAVVSDKMRREIYGKLLKLGNSYPASASRDDVAKMLTEDMVAVEEYYSEFLPAIGFAFLGTLTMVILLTLVNAMVAAACSAAIIAIIIGFVMAKKYQHIVSIKYLIAALDTFTFFGAALGFKSSIEELVVGNIQLEWAIIILFLCMVIFKPLRNLGELLPNGITDAITVGKILAFLEKRNPKEGKQEIGDEPVRIVFENVYYSFNGQEVLKSASILIPPGKVTGLTGAKGAGKSTLAGIITKRNRAYKGSVKINGKELSNVKEAELLNDLTYINEESYVFKSTVRSNLQLGNPKVSDKKMMGALSVVGLWPEIKEIGGLDLSLDRDDILTPGQKQRLLLARAFLKNAKLYVFDNVTELIDDHSKEIIIKLISQLGKDMGRTVLLISDNYEDLKSADKIYTLSEGMIDEYGKGIKSN